MKNKLNGIEPHRIDPRQTLRTEAEKLVASVSPKEMTAQPAEILLHELLVHKIELEMQNEELRRAQAAIEEARDRYVDLYEFAPVGYLTISRDGLINEINLTGAGLLGTDRTKLLKRRFSQFIAPQDKDRWYRLFLNMMAVAKGDKQAFDIQMLHANSSVFHAHLDCLRSEPLNAPPTLRIALTDISKTKQIEKELHIAATAFESRESIIVTDDRAIILKVNQAFIKMTGYSADEATGQTPKLLRSGRHNQAFYAAMRETINEEGAWQGEIWNRRKNGEIYPVWLTITAIYGDGVVLHYVATQTDISQQKAASEQIEQLVFYDPLTHLANRRLLIDRLHLALASSARSKKYGALLFIDLDNFKTINDTLGHNMGDLMLQQVAQRLMNNIRESDTVARLGGDEFVVMLEDLDEHSEKAVIHTETVGKKILAVLNEPYQLAGYDYHCTSSIGATLFYAHTVPEDDLLKHVDIAMYQAKHEGRNALCFFDKTMQSGLIERTALETDLRLAVEKGQFTLYYQIQNTLDGQAVGAEVLIRWKHPKFGLISPIGFIPLAEETGLILAIGQWVLETACAQLNKWAGHPLTRELMLAVNISARQFHQPDFVPKIITLIGQFAIRPGRLKLELTESLVIINIADTITKMKALRDIGVQFSMDEFGTGYSSLSYLTRLPLDQLKIDRSFIRNLGIKPPDAAIIQTIIGMTKTLGIEVIAEGVETEEQRTFLERHGCTLWQGHLFSQPLPLDEFEALLQRNLKL